MKSQNAFVVKIGSSEKIDDAINLIGSVYKNLYTLMCILRLILLYQKSQVRDGNVFEEFNVEMCDNFLTCNMELEHCLEDCANDSACINACLRNHADCESN